jgi:hypothetical protein
MPALRSNAFALRGSGVSQSRFVGHGLVEVAAARAFDDHQGPGFALAMDACLADGAFGGGASGAGGKEFLPLLRGPSPETPPLGIGKACDLDFSAAVVTSEDQEVPADGGIKMAGDGSPVMGATGKDPFPESIDQVKSLCWGEGRHRDPLYSKRLGAIRTAQPCPIPCRRRALVPRALGGTQHSSTIALPVREVEEAYM